MYITIQYALLPLVVQTLMSEHDIYAQPGYMQGLMVGVFSVL